MYGSWLCSSLLNVHMPCFYADNHDILSMKLFDLDKDGEPPENQEETANIVPRAIKAAAYRGMPFRQIFHRRGMLYAFVNLETPERIYEYSSVNT